MSRAEFPTITPDVAHRYIQTARLTPNAVKFRIRQILSPRMKVVCAWCNKSIREIACEAAMHGETTHGICDECSEKYFGFTLQRDTPTCERSDRVGYVGIDTRNRAAISSPVVSSATPAKEMARIRAEAGDGDSLSSGSHFGAASAKQSCGPNVSNESKECREALARQVTPAATDQSSDTAPGSINCPPLEFIPSIGDANTTEKATERGVTACENRGAISAHG